MIFRSLKIWPIYNDLSWILAFSPLLIYYIFIVLSADVATIKISRNWNSAWGDENGDSHCLWWSKPNAGLTFAFSWFIRYLKLLDCREVEQLDDGCGIKDPGNKCDLAVVENYCYYPIIYYNTKKILKILY